MAEIGTKKDPNPNLEKEEQPNTPSDLLSPSPVKDPFQFPPPPPKKKKKNKSGGIFSETQIFFVFLRINNTKNF